MEKSVKRLGENRGVLGVRNRILSAPGRWRRCSRAESEGAEGTKSKGIGIHLAHVAREMIDATFCIKMISSRHCVSFSVTRFFVLSKKRIQRYPRVALEVPWESVGIRFRRHDRLNDSSNRKSFGDN